MVALHFVARKVPILLVVSAPLSAVRFFAFGLPLVLPPRIALLGRLLSRLFSGLLAALLRRRLRSFPSAFLGNPFSNGSHDFLAVLRSCRRHPSPRDHRRCADRRVDLVALGQVDQGVGTVGNLSHPRDQTHYVQSGVYYIAAPALPPALFFFGWFDRWRVVPVQVGLRVKHDQPPAFQRTRILTTQTNCPASCRNSPHAHGHCAPSLIAIILVAIYSCTTMGTGTFYLKSCCIRYAEDVGQGLCSKAIDEGAAAPHTISVFALTGVRYLRNPVS